MLKLRLAFAVILACIVNTSFANEIAIECKYKNIGGVYEKLLESRGQKRPWWHFLSEQHNSKITLSIDIDKRKVTYPDGFIIESVTPKVFSVLEYNLSTGLLEYYRKFEPSKLSTYKSSNYKCLNGMFCIMAIYDIDRINGKLKGYKYASDDSYFPLAKKGDYMWQIEGKCKLLDKTF